MIYLLISSVILMAVLFVIYIKQNIKLSEKLIPSLNIEKDNVTIAREMLKILENNHTTIEDNKDETSNLSYYNHAKDVIILKTNNAGSSRIVQIAHECIHTIQKKKFLIANKSFSNLQLLYFLISLIMIIKIEKIEFILIPIQLIILLGTIFVKVVIEGDASYRSVDLAKKYLEGKVEEQELNVYVEKTSGLIYNLMPIYYYNFLLQGMTMIIINILVGLIS